MKVSQALKQRSSCRDFKSTKLNEQEIQALKDAALASPTALNAQDLKINVVQDQNLLKEISDQCFSMFDSATQKRMKERGASSIFYNAPLVFILSSPSEDYADLNAGIVAQSICLTATELGLGSCIIGLARQAFESERKDYFAGKFNFASEEKFCVAVAVGHENTSKDPHEFNLDQIREF